MKKRRLILFLLLPVLVLGAVLLLLLLSSVHDPPYRGRPASVWTGELNSSDVSVQRHAQEAILELGPDAVPVLSRGVNMTGLGKYHRIRSWISRLASHLGRSLSRRVDAAVGMPRGYYAGSGAAIMLGEMGPDAREAVPALLRALDDADPNVRSCAACALIEIAPDDDRVIDMLSRKLFQDQEPWILGNVAHRFYEIDPSNQAAIPLILKTLIEGSDPGARAYAASALGNFAASNGPAATSLTSALADADPYVRIGAAESLQRMHRPTRHTPARWKGEVPASLDDIRTNGPALAEIYPELTGALPLLAGDLNVSNNWTRVRAAGAIWKVTHRKDLIVPALTQVAKGGDAWQVASLMLASLGEGSKTAVPLVAKELSGQLADSSYGGTMEIDIHVLARFGPAAQEAAPVLRAALTNEYASVRLSAARALWRMDAEPKEVLPLLEMWLQTGGAFTKAHTAEILAEMGPAAKGSLPALRSLLDDKSENVRRAAAEAVEQIANDGNIRETRP
jgi:HEAT repeat protein